MPKKLIKIEVWGVHKNLDKTKYFILIYIYLHIYIQYTYRRCTDKYPNDNFELNLIKFVVYALLRLRENQL